MGMTIIGIDDKLMMRLQNHRRPNEDIDKTIERLLNIVEVIGGDHI